MGNVDEQGRAWRPEELAALDAAAELEIAVRRPDGSERRWTPIWVVNAAGQAFVRTWYRRDTGWFGAAVRSGRARIRVPGLTAEVRVDDVGDGDPELSAQVDAGFRAKYGPQGAGSMITEAAVAATLRLVPLGG